MWRRQLLSFTGPLFTEAAAFTQIKKERKIRLCLDLGSPVAYISKPAKNTLEAQFLFFLLYAEASQHHLNTQSVCQAYTSWAVWSTLGVCVCLGGSARRLPKSVKVLADPCAVQNV